MSTTVRSAFLLRVLGALRDHPHDDSVQAVATLLAVSETDALAALIALEQEGLVSHARDHWMLSRQGWATARADDPYQGLD